MKQAGIRMIAKTAIVATLTLLPGNQALKSLGPNTPWLARGICLLYCFGITNTLGYLGLKLVFKYNLPGDRPVS